MNAQGTLHFASPEWQARFAARGLDRFATLWDAEGDWVEPRNERRGGFSGVTRVLLDGVGNASGLIYLKRQRNHFTRQLLLPWRREPTALREWRNLEHLAQAGVAVCTPVCHGERRAPDGAIEAIIATAALDDHVALKDLVARWRSAAPPSRSERRHLARSIARTVTALHRARIRHGCLHAKHVFMAPDGSAALIDLEKGRPCHLASRALLRDLAQLARHTDWPDIRDRLAVFHACTSEAGLTRKAARRLRERIRKRVQRGRT